MGKRRARAEPPAWRPAAARRLDQLLALPMLVLTLVFLIVVVILIVDRHMPPTTRSILNTIDIGIWTAFLAEYLARLFVAPKRLTFIRRNIFDLLLVVIPVLRPLGAMRSLRLLRVACLVRIGAASGRAVRESRVRFASRAALVAVGTVSVLILTAAAMAFDDEHNAHRANIKTFADAVWWALSTVATVGYGDKYPVTAAGRAIGAVLMITSVGLFGAIAASMAAWFISVDGEQSRPANQAQIAHLTAEVTALREALSHLSSQVTGHRPQSGDPAGPPSRSLEADGP